MARTATLIELTQLEQTLLRKILHARHATGKDLHVRVQIVLAAADQLTNKQIQKQYGIEEHRVATLVLLVSVLCGLPLFGLGKVEKHGVLKSQETRRRFLEDAGHRIRFVYTPKHCSWLNQIEIWFSGLSRRVLRRGSFHSVDELQAKILEYVAFYNTTARPMNWKYEGTPKTKTIIAKSI